MMIVVCLVASCLPAEPCRRKSAVVCCFSLFPSPPTFFALLSFVNLASGQADLPLDSLYKSILEHTFNMLRTVSSARSAVASAARPSSVAATKASQGELCRRCVPHAGTSVQLEKKCYVWNVILIQRSSITVCASRQLSTLRISQRVEPALKINGVRRAAVPGKLLLFTSHSCSKRTLWYKLGTWESILLISTYLPIIFTASRKWMISRSYAAEAGSKFKRTKPVSISHLRQCKSYADVLWLHYRPCFVL